ILLPVHKVVRRRDPQRIGKDRGGRMRRRAEANGLGAEVDRTVVFVMRDVVQRDEDRHGQPYSSSLLEQNTGSREDQATTTGRKCPQLRRTVTRQRRDWAKTYDPALASAKYWALCNERPIPHSHCRAQDPGRELRAAEIKALAFGRL